MKIVGNNMDAYPEITTYVVSLANSPRRSYCASVLEKAGIPFVFHDAVNGNILSEVDIQRYVDFDLNKRKFKRILSKKEVGCYLSHRQIWEKVASGNNDYALVLEDDCDFDGNFGEFLKHLSRFDISNVLIKLDGQISKRRCLKINTAVKVGNSLVGAAKHIPALTTGYIIGKSAAVRMLRARERFFRPVDIDLKFFWEHRVPIFLTDKVLVREVESAAQTSSIACERENLKPNSMTQRFFMNMKYQIDFKFRSVIYNTKHKNILCDNNNSDVLRFKMSNSVI